MCYISRYVGLFLEIKNYVFVRFYGSFSLLQIRKSLKENRKWTVFVVNTVPLVYQQGHAIHKHTAFDVGVYERSRGVDVWTDEDVRVNFFFLSR